MLRVAHEVCIFPLIDLNNNKSPHVKDHEKLKGSTKVKTIIFIRHAKVDLDLNEAIPSKKLKAWEEDYNSAPIVTNVLPSLETQEQIKNADHLLCSELSRTRASVALIDIKVHEVNALFNEAAIPSFNGSFLKLKPTTWLVLFRLLSLLGFGRWALTLKETKAQAKAASERLALLSQEHNNMVLVGHGVMNWLIRKELLSQGWQSQGKDAYENWGATILTSSS